MLQSSKEIRLLLLGPGESGKSTVFKQMKIIQDRGGFLKEELKAFLPIVHSNCISQMKVLVESSVALQVPLGNQAKMCSEMLLKYNDEVLTPEIARMIKSLWQDEGIKVTYEKRGKFFHMNDTAEYFFEHAERFAEEDYLPTTDDVLRARIRSIGIEEAGFSFEKLNFTMIDVGGQRSERRKWIHCFSNVTAIIFVVSLSSYDQSLREDSSQNTMKEALLLFEEVANSTYFSENAIILFLNKTDLFEEKINRVSLKVCFEEYTGKDNFEEGKVFIKSLFTGRTTNIIYPHFTCALDTKDIQIVITAVRDTLLQSTFADAGF